MNTIQQLALIVFQYPETQCTIGMFDGGRCVVSQPREVIIDADSNMLGAVEEWLTTNGYVYDFAYRDDTGEDMVTFYLN